MIIWMISGIAAFGLLVLFVKIFGKEGNYNDDGREV